MTTTPPDPDDTEPTEPFAKDEDGTPDYGRVNAPPPPYGTPPEGYAAPPAGYPPQGYYAYGIAPVSSAKATWALVLGILSVMCCYIGVIIGPTALLLGISANQEIKRSGGTVTGGGLAIAGIVTGAVGTAVHGAFIGFAILGAIID